MRRRCWFSARRRCGRHCMDRCGSAADNSRDWPAYSGDKGSTKYSSLDQINRDTVGKLRIAWRQSAVPEELKAIVSRRAGTDQLAEHAAHGRRAALHEQRRRHRGRARRGDGQGRLVRHPAARGRASCRRAPDSTRGVAYWANGNDSRIFAMNGPNLIALNAKTGKRYPNWGRRRRSIWQRSATTAAASPAIATAAARSSCAT